MKRLHVALVAIAVTASFGGWWWLEGSSTDGVGPEASRPAGAAFPWSTAPSTDVGAASAAPSRAAGQSGPGVRARLQELVASGSPEDAMRAYGLLHECRMAATLEERARRARPGQVNEHDAKRLASGEMRRDTELACGDLQPQDQQQRLALLQKAAAAGVRNAALYLIDEGPFGDPSALSTRATDPLVIEWRRDTMKLLELAGTRGDTGALLSLSDQYLTGTGIVLGADPKLALVYRTALDLTYERTKGRELPDKAKSVNRMKARLSAAEVEEAVAAGKSLAARTS